MLRRTLILIGVLVASRAWADEHVWLEGEDAKPHTFNKHSWYSTTDVRKDLLSPGTPGGAAGDWLGHFDNSGQGATAQWSFSLKEGGDYTVWLRCNPFKTRHAIQIDGGASQNVDLASDPRERLNLIAPKIDMRFIAWVRAATVKLGAGAHTITLTVTKEGTQAHAGVDALVLANFKWAPSGAVKPPAPGAPAPKPDEWFPLFPDDDPHDPASITDVSKLLHAPAGKHGALGRKGAALQFADGTPVKLWGVNAAMAATEQLQEQQARFYAKNGVNLVRQHPVEGVVGLLQTGAGGARELDAAKLATFDRWFATLKKHGIYMAWSPFYPHVITPDDGYPQELYAELPDRGGGKSSSGVVGFMPKLQDAEWAWLEALLEHKNPHTGLRYVDDPALAIVETHNEDSVFWHAPLNDLATGASYPKHTAELKKLWGQWVKARYGDDTKLKQAWGAGMKSGDSVSSQTMPIYGAWEMAADGPQNAAEKQRMGDFIRFLAETQRAFFDKRESRLRALGFKGVTVTTAWKAGGAAADAANLWCDDAADAIDRHNYFGGGKGGHDIIEGKVANSTHLGLPGRGILSIGLYQVEDKPFFISEWTQKPPNQWKAEIAPLVAAYGMGLQGWDAVMHFAASRVRMGGGWPGGRSYVTETPHYLGQFPALARAVHLGHFTEGRIVFGRRLAEDAVFKGVDALKQDFTESGYDDKEPKANPETPVEVLAIGRVTAKIKDGQAAPQKDDWTQHWDKTKKIVKSVTGELIWDYDRRLVTIETRKTQGVIGFAGGQTVELPDVTVKVTTKFVSLLLTPLDDQPLGQSSHVLITALAQDRQLGAVYSADGFTLQKLGGPPLYLEPVQATLTFKGASLTSARAVDQHGVPTATEIERSDQTITIDGRYATYYYEVRTSAPPPPDASGAGDGAATGDGGATGDGKAGDGKATSRGDDGCSCDVGRSRTDASMLLVLVLALAGLGRRRR